MIGLDTNVLVRYIVQDDPEQAQAATQLIEGRCTTQSQGYVSVPVLIELVWVLSGHYNYSKPVVVSVVRQVLRTAEFTVEDHDLINIAVYQFEAGNADFADYVIARRNYAHGCETTYTFDREAGQEEYFELVS